MNKLKVLIVGLLISTIVESMDEKQQQKGFSNIDALREKLSQDEYFERVYPMINTMAMLKDERQAVQDSQLGLPVKNYCYAQIDDQLKRLNSQIDKLNDLMLKRAK